MQFSIGNLMQLTDLENLIQQKKMNMYHRCILCSFLIPLILSHMCRKLTQVGTYNDHYIIYTLRMWNLMRQKQMLCTEVKKIYVRTYRMCAVT